MAKQKNKKAKKEAKKDIVEIENVSVEEKKESIFDYEESKDIRETSAFLSRIREILIIHRTACIVVGIVILVIIVSLIIYFEVGGNKNKDEKTHEEKLYDYLEEIGKKWYETDYYDGICQTKKDECKAYLAGFSEIGIKVDLDNLSRYPDVFEEYQDEFVNDETDKECDKQETKIIIYPEDDYDKEDYRLETILVCGYDK